MVKQRVLLTMLLGLLLNGGVALSSRVPGIRSSPMQATTSTYLFLHGTGPSDNPPALFLSNTSPIATNAKFKDSPSVNFNGGNPWKMIGAWGAEAANIPQDLTTLGPMRAWLGLKNSDDQGTQFDLKVEVYRNSDLIASGQTLCITGITRNPNQAKEVTVQFGAIPIITLAAGDVLSVKLFTRIGTTAQGAKCTGPGGSHNNAVGLRLYFDAANRPSSLQAVSSPHCPDSPISIGFPVDCSRIIKVSKTIQASVGGSIELPSGTVLDIPASALDADTEISLFEIPVDFADNPAVLAMVEIRPDGLQLRRPSTLTLKYNPSLVMNGDVVAPYVYNRSAPPTDFGSELSITEPLGLVNSDPATGSVSVSVEHFSGFFATISELARLVMEIPLKFLQKGDILVQVSNCDPGDDCDFVPGHTAMYMGNDKSTDPFSDATDGSTIVEAGGTGGSVALSKPPSSFATVTGSTLAFRRGYMGARTPIGRSPTDRERTQIAKFAKLEAQNHVPYSIIGALTGSGETCSGLVAKSYLFAGIPLENPLSPSPFPFPAARAAIETPLGIMRETVPVRHIKANVGEEIRIPVNAMVGKFKPRVVGGILLTGNGLSYERNPQGTTINVAGLPNGAQFVGNSVDGKTLVWTPAPDDFGQTFHIEFTATVPFLGSVSNFVDISVTDKFSYVYDARNGRLMTQEGWSVLFGNPPESENLIIDQTEGPLANIVGGNLVFVDARLATLPITVEYTVRVAGGGVGFLVIGQNFFAGLAISQEGLVLIGTSADPVLDLFVPMNTTDRLHTYRVTVDANRNVNLYIDGSDTPFGPVPGFVGGFSASEIRFFNPDLFVQRIAFKEGGAFKPSVCCQDH